MTSPEPNENLGIEISEESATGVQIGSAFSETPQRIPHARDYGVAQVTVGPIVGIDEIPAERDPKTTFFEKGRCTSELEDQLLGQGSKVLACHAAYEDLYKSCVLVVVELPLDTPAAFSTLRLKRYVG